MSALLPLLLCRAAGTNLNAAMPVQAGGLISGAVDTALHAVSAILPSSEVANDGAEATPEAASVAAAPEVESAATPQQPEAAGQAELSSAADCEAFLRGLPGGTTALEQAASVTASLNARRDTLRQEELTFLLQVAVSASPEGNPEKFIQSFLTLRSEIRLFKMVPRCCDSLHATSKHGARRNTPSGRCSMTPIHKPRMQ